MAEQEKKPEQNLSADAWKKAIKSWQERTRDTGIVECDLPEKLPDRFKQN